MQQHCMRIFETLQALLKHWQYLFQKEAKRKRDERLRSYRKYPYVANKSLPPQSFVDVLAPHEETDITANIEKIDNRIREYWTSIWTKPAWDRTSVEDLFLDAVEPGVEIALEPITTGDVSAAIKRAKGVGGADGWSAQELKNASPLYDQLASIYHCMEAAGIVPSVSLVGDITLIPKAGGSITCQGMRPRTVLSLLRRIYSASRLRKTLFALPGSSNTRKRNDGMSGARQRQRSYLAFGSSA